MVYRQQIKCIFLKKNSGADLRPSGRVLRNDLEPGSNQVFDYVLLLYVTRIVGRRQLGAQSRPDPIPTRLIPTGPDPEYRTIVTSFLITQVWPPWAKSEQLFGFYSAQRILLLDPEQKKLQQVLEFL